MTKKQIRKFTKKINFGIEYPIKFYYNSKDKHCAYHYNKINLITFNTYWLQKSNDKYTKIIIAHEVGHEYANIDYHCRHKSMNELKATLWSAERLWDLKMYNLSKCTIDQLKKK